MQGRWLRSRGLAGLAAGMVLAGALACGGDAPGSDDAIGTDADAWTDATADLPGPGDVAAETALDVDALVPGDPSTADAPCAANAWTCSDDASMLRVCQDGAWVETDCRADHGRLCDGGACVDPWRYGSPQWGTCPSETRGTPEALAQKAAILGDVAWRIHFSPALGFVLPATLKHHEVDCPAGVTGPCYQPDTPEAQATWQDVEAWHGYENEGGEAIQYGAALAFEYAVTKSPETLAHLKAVMAREVDRMKVTGVPGLFTREMIPPNVPGLSCPTDDASYTVDPTKTNNMWVRIEDDGCVHVVDADTHLWKATDHCGLTAYAGWCWLDNVSQDEYGTHMNALADIAKVVDDPDVQATVNDLITQVGVHLMTNHLTLVDWDGRVTEHGKLYATALVDSPGFLAGMSLDFVRMAAEVSGRADLKAFYLDCLLQRSGTQTCLPWPMEADPKPYSEWIQDQALYIGTDGCLSNYDNLSMAAGSFDSLAWFEPLPDLRDLYQGVFDTQIMRAPGFSNALSLARNPWWGFMWAAHKKLGPGTDGPAFQAVEEGICSLKQFPASKHQRARDPSAYPEHCTGKNGSSLAADSIPVADRCLSTFIWWGDPRYRATCTEAAWELYVPMDYLLAYWSGRYFGFIPEGL